MSTDITENIPPLFVNEQDEDRHINTLLGILDGLSELRGRMSRETIQSGELQDLSDETGDDSSLVETYVVLRCSAQIKEEALVWLVEKIKGKRRNGGAELVVFKQPPRKKKEIVLHVSASKIKLLEVAEEMELMKTDRNGQIREFSVSQLEEFLLDGMHTDDLFTMAERQTIVHHELENIRALPEDDHIPFYPKWTLYEGQSVVHACIQAGLISRMYPLHDKEALKKLGKQWYMQLMQEQPLEEIHLYFGDAVALYFTFLGYYTTALIIPVILGFIQLLMSAEAMPFFCLFNVVWTTVFLEIWKRKSNELAFQWGTIGMTSLDDPRPNFHGHMGVDAVTGRVTPQFPRWKTNAKMYCVSFPIVFLCMVGGFIVMLVSFWMEDYIRKSYAEEEAGTYLVHLPSILYAAVVYIVNRYYRVLATRLTEWENHRTQSQYDRHRVIKLVLFEFVNNFMCLFYIAFIMQDMDMLRMQLATMLIIFQAINNFQEAVLPLIVKFYVKKMKQLKIFLNQKSKKDSDSETSIYDEDIKLLPTIPTIPMGDPRMQAAEEESKLESYEGTYDDYLEMFIQFGYVVLFSSVYPIAAFWAVLNNVLEIRGDAFKLCLVYQRPLSKRVKDIGAWQKSFEILGALSIMTNCGLLCLSPQMKQIGSTYGAGEWILTFVILEHLLLGLRYILYEAIPDKPLSVRVALARQNYQSKQALKKELKSKQEQSDIYTKGHVLLKHKRPVRASEKSY